MFVIADRTNLLSIVLVCWFTINYIKMDVGAYICLTLLYLDPQDIFLSVLLQNNQDFLRLTAPKNVWFSIKLMPALKQLNLLSTNNLFRRELEIRYSYFKVKAKQRLNIVDSSFSSGQWCWLKRWENSRESHLWKRHHRELAEPEIRHPSPR